MTLAQIDWARAYPGLGLTIASLEKAYSPSRVLEALATHLPRGAESRVLELGCAPGRWLAWLELRLRVRSLGLELEPEGIRLSRELYPELPLVRGDAFQLPFAAGSFDAVFSIGLIEHFEDPTPIVRETRRVLKPGGVSLWLVPNLATGSVCGWHWKTFRRENYDAHRVYTMEQLAGVVERGGLRVVHQEYSGLYIPHCQRVMGRLPLRSALRRLERPNLASNLIVVARP